MVVYTLEQRLVKWVCWKVDALKTSYCLVRILIQIHNWAHFLRKWARRGWRKLKTEEEDIDNIWFQQDGATCHTAEAILDGMRPVFEDRIISRRADVVWAPRNCDLSPLDYYLWGAVKDKCYANKPNTIDTLRDNIREPIGEIQLKNCTDYVGYCMASRGSHLNEFIFHY